MVAAAVAFARRRRQASHRERAPAQPSGLHRRAPLQLRHGARRARGLGPRGTRRDGVLTPGGHRGRGPPAGQRTVASRPTPAFVLELTRSPGCMEDRQGAVRAEMELRFVAPSA